MRILYVDIDSLRADHLGCYGYARNTSPHIDRIAETGIRFDRCYTSDSPCLPSRSALLTGRLGIRNGVVTHGGTAAELFPEGPTRGFFSQLTQTSWPGRMRRAGLKTVTISTFGERHSAYHWYAGFQEAYNIGRFGMERADEVTPVALDWLDRNGTDDNWFLHFHIWDPHTPYRAPESFGDPFGDAAHPDWLSEAIRTQHWQGTGPHSAREPMGFGVSRELATQFPRQPVEIDSPASIRMMFDGYDTGIRYADEHVGHLVQKLDALGILDETAIVISSDHGETLGELNVYCDHHLADEFTNRVPMIVRWPGAEPGVNRGLHYQIDVAATLLELLGTSVPDNWDGQSFAETFPQGTSAGRDFLVLSQAAWTCQRSVRFENWIYIRTYHDGYHEYPDRMLFDLEQDPHEQQDLARERPDIVSHADDVLTSWHAEMMGDHPTGTDPFETVLVEGGPWHVRGQLSRYLERLKRTGRTEAAERLARAHPGE